VLQPLHKRAVARSARKLRDDVAVLEPRFHPRLAPAVADAHRLRLQFRQFLVDALRAQRKPLVKSGRHVLPLRRVRLRLCRRGRAQFSVQRDERMLADAVAQQERQMFVAEKFIRRQRTVQMVPVYVLVLFGDKNAERLHQPDRLQQGRRVDQLLAPLFAQLDAEGQKQGALGFERGTADPVGRELLMQHPVKRDGQRTGHRLIHPGQHRLLQRPDRKIAKHAKPVVFREMQGTLNFHQTTPFSTKVAISSSFSCISL